MPQGWSGTVTPSLSGYTSPALTQLQQRRRQPAAQDYTRSASAATSTTLTRASGHGGTSVTFTATVTGSNPTGSVSFTEAACVGCAPTLTGSQRSPPAAPQPAVGTHSIVANYAGDAAMPPRQRACSQVINRRVAAASFVATDLATQGNWKGHYGSDGYAILNDSTSYPAYAVVTPTGKSGLRVGSATRHRSARPAARRGRRPHRRLLV